MEITLVLFALTVFCTLISCGAAVVSGIYASKPASVELQSHVDELVGLVDKMMKESRKEKMSRVRSAAKDAGNPAEHTGGTEGVVPLDTKAQLRQLARQKGFVR